MSEISSQEYAECCKSFVLASNQLSDHWSIFSTNTKSTSYRPIIMKKFLQPFGIDVDKKELSQDCQLRSFDMITIECHITYSKAYCNPVLYFSASKMNGQMLSLSECWDHILKHKKDLVNEGQKWSVVTQSEHPVLLRPFFVLHPCHTQHFLKPICEKQSFNYLVAWLSIVLPVLGLDINAESYYQHFIINRKSN